MAPTVHGVELSPGEEVDDRDIPICHDEPMARAGDLFSCHQCPTVVEYDDGLVFDIRN
ncbi:hypothetical protein [Streptomyces sp. NBC_01614]|uniref:hypothetical protein n=1 Tax=Streptomyces sp. NBC_01614 TaxID=2975897 RepID=UPI00386A8159